MPQFICLLFLVLGINLQAQKLYVPYNIQKAYNNQSRDYAGIPGHNYFQNRSSYEIKASFDPVSGLLKGKENISYYNTSGDTLTYLVVRLYHDIFKKGNMRDEEFPAEYITEGVEIKSLRINGEEYFGNSLKYYNRQGTNLYLPLSNDLYPGDSVKLYISWNTQLPPGHAHRFGKYGESDWFVALWYPQLAVYDDIDGWDTWHYAGYYEFYNDFNNYSVEISVPSGHLVWATGKWLNPEEILTQRVLSNYLNINKSNETTHVVTKSDWDKKQVTRKAKKLQFKFSGNEIPDFAFAVSDDYIWDAASTITDSVNENNTTISAVYSPTNKDFKKLAILGAKAVNHFSFSSLGIEYPYHQATIFDGAGGMEFPMIINQSGSNATDNFFIAMHELFHGYFPFLTGINERKYAWLDEGLTSYLPMETEIEVNGSGIFQMPTLKVSYNMLAGEDMDIPLMAPSVLTRENSYYHQAYQRSVMAFSVLEGHIGRDNFRTLIRTFIKNWRGKHPTGYDLLFTLINGSNEDIAWLIKPWFFEFGWADLGIGKVIYSGDSLSIEIDNLGGLPVPIELKLVQKNNKIIEKNYRADCWKNGIRSYKIELTGIEDVERIELGSRFIPDKEEKNNYFYIRP